ncbi:GNAT family N-acetyltransferase [Lactococcus protaetiae]|uniref:GNAT family N-acetyltransferase n=2 Tax=Lactococcus protaetiae TaxID=2592653 RepID=A0A514ZBB7_9LACT|nr:GNAT family N-acetyltransferase [Lactococcus protaetiae]
MIETERLILREWENDDVPNLNKFLQDSEVMYAYEHAFSDEEVLNWLNWNQQSYKENGYGLWAVELKETGQVIGECGITDQIVEGKSYKEIGYHLIKEFWHHGFAVEAAQAVKKYAFEKLKAGNVTSIVRDTNLASMNVAIRNNMIVKSRFTKRYRDIVMPHYLFMIEKEK